MLTASEWIQISVGVVLLLTLLAVAWYAHETRRMAKATEKLAIESERQRLARNDALISVCASGAIAESSTREVSPLGIRVVCSNAGPGSAYNVEPIIIGDRRVGNVRTDWANGDYSCGPNRLTRAPWAVLPVGQSDDRWWEITWAVGYECVAVALYKDGLSRLWASAYGFRLEESGLVSTEAIPPHIQGNLPAS
jgi:hypothetical protein